MKGLLIVWWFFVGTALAQPQPGSAAKPETAQPTGSVSGTVVDAVSGAPLRKARVSSTGSGREVAITDASGAFSFDSAKPGTQIISAEHPEYPHNLSQFAANAKFLLAPGERKSGVEIRLQPAASLGGRIMDADGDPIAGCNVMLLSEPGRMALPGNTIADKNGDYIFNLVPAGKYYLQAKCSSPYLQPRPFAAPNALLPGPQLGFSPRYYPNSPDSSAAQKIKVLPGQSLRGIDFRFSPETVSWLAVRITGSSPTAVRASLNVLPNTSAAQSRGEERYVAGRGPTGAIVFPGVVPGTYLLSVYTASAQQLLLASQVVQVTDQPKTITVTAAPSVPLSGIVIANPEKADVVTNKGRRQNQHRLWLFDVENPALSTNADIKPDGAFQLPAITPGHYRVSIPNGAWVQSVAIDGVSSDGPEVVIRAGVTGPLEIHTGKETGTISGDLQGLTSGVAQVRIILASAGPSNNRSTFDMGMFPVQPPHFSLQMPPGHYNFYVAEQDPSEEMVNVVGNEVLSLRGTEIDIRAGKEITRNIKVITAADIRRENQ